MRSKGLFRAERPAINISTVERSGGDVWIGAEEEKDKDDLGGVGSERKTRNKGERGRDEESIVSPTLFYKPLSSPFFFVCLRHCLDGKIPFFRVPTLEKKKRKTMAGGGCDPIGTLPDASSRIEWRRRRKNKMGAQGSTHQPTVSWNVYVYAAEAEKD